MMTKITNVQVQVQVHCVQSVRLVVEVRQYFFHYCVNFAVQEVEALRLEEQNKKKLSDKNLIHTITIIQSSDFQKEFCEEQQPFITFISTELVGGFEA